MATTDGTTVEQQALYEPLSREKLEVRVLDLEHSANYDSDLHCKLRKISLLDLKPGTSGPQSFEALSYTWGDVSTPGRVFINKQHTNITRNLESFLRHRRQADETVTLWIDAIAINQNDELEKNYQIPLMNMIYGVASKLTIWLGPSSNDSSLAFELLHNLGRSSPYSKMPLLDRKDFTAIQNLLSRPWWTRVWIVQELVTGGMGLKQNVITIQCGNDSTLWANFVIAAARMKAHNEDLRQYCPNIDNILELDSLRDSAFNFLMSTGPRCTSFDLLCRYRNFDATNPRDKLYAIHNMLSKRLSGSMTARYDACVTDVYTDFASDKIRTTRNLEIFRHCGQSQHELPSWVPDWSVRLRALPLPLRRIPRYLDVPWWANPVQVKPDQGTTSYSADECPSWEYLVAPYPKNAAEAAHQRKIKLKRLELSARGYGVISDLEEIPPDFTFHNLPDNMKEIFRTGLVRGNFALTVRDERCLPVDSQHYRMDQPDALRQGEIETERSMKTWLLQELTESDTGSKYLAARNTNASIEIDEDRSLLKVKGILWDSVETCHEEFVEDLAADWKNTTRFMVTVGLCKALALSQKSAAERYVDVHEAFWSTLLVGQTVDLEWDNEDDDLHKSVPYDEWLPEVPPHWTVTEPPLTVTTSGLVDLSERLRAIDHVLNTPKPDNNEPELKKFETKSLSYDEYDPKLWSEDDQRQRKAELADLASMWHQQPYDLYHRPFSFLHIVPDPYWDTRKDQDELARQRSRQHVNMPIVSPPPVDCRENDPNNDTVTKQQLQDYTSAVKTELMNKTSMVPKGTLKAGIEQYALGRQFFVTKGGYFGLGPKGIRKDDRVAVIFGSNVPFILRKCDAVGSGTRGWQLIGETYVHGAMRGEVIDLWELGVLEAGTISLR